MQTSAANQQIAAEELALKPHRPTRPELREAQSAMFYEQQQVEIRAKLQQTLDTFLQLQSAAASPHQLAMMQHEISQLRQQLSTATEKSVSISKRAHRLEMSLHRAHEKIDQLEAKVATLQVKLRDFISTNNVEAFQQQMDILFPSRADQRFKPSSVFTTFLRNAFLLINAGSAQAVRHDPELVPFCLYVYNLGGPKLYQLLATHLHLPSLDCVERARHKALAIGDGVSAHALQLSLAIIQEVCVVTNGW